MTGLWLFLVLVVAVYVFVTLYNIVFVLFVIPSCKQIEAISLHEYRVGTQPMIRRVLFGPPALPEQHEDDSCQCFRARFKGFADAYVLVKDVAHGTYLCELSHAKAPRHALVTTFTSDGSKSCWTCGAMAFAIWALDSSQVAMRYGHTNVIDLDAGTEHDRFVHRFGPDLVPTPLNTSFGEFLLSMLHGKYQQLRAKPAWTFMAPFWTLRAQIRASKSVEAFRIPTGFLERELK